MTPAFIAKETAICCGINAAFSLGFYFLAFHGEEIVKLGRGAKFAFDFLPQAAAVGFFSSFPPVLIVNHRIRKGKVAGTPRPVLQIFLRAIAIGLISLAVFGSAGFVIVQMLDGAIGFPMGAIVKVLFGIAVAAIITPIALNILSPRVVDEASRRSRRDRQVTLSASFSDGPAGDKR